MHRNKKRRQIVIISLIIVLIGMTVGYATYSSNVEIKGTSTITSSWDIQITNITGGTPTGTAENAKAPTWKNTEASMEANLYKQGDAMEYDITIENKGTLDAKLDNIITDNKNSNTEAILISFTGYKKGEVLKANQSKIVHVKIEYNPNYEGEETSSETEITFDFIQESSDPNKENTYVLTYDYMTNGGSMVDSEGIYLESGSNVDLTNKAYKHNWNFIGWNTDKTAKEPLTTFQMPENDVTLYAIYKKDLKATYQKGLNIESIAKEEDICTIYNNETSCAITLPEITPKEGFVSAGWSTQNGSTSGTMPGEIINLTQDIIYYANAVDNEKPKITLNPNTQTTYIQGGKEVTVNIEDKASGLKANQIVYYAWSQSNQETPTFTNSITTSNVEGAKETQIIIPQTETETLTGSYYLWINSGISDTNNNQTDMTISDVFKFDNEEPVLSISTTNTTNSITVVANASAESSISKYEYSLDDTSWIDAGTSNTYVIENLTQGTTHTVSVRITNGVGKTVTQSKEVTVNTIPNVTFQETDAYPKTVTITYPEGCGSTLTCTYQKDNGEIVNVTEQTVDVSFDYHGTVATSISDGINIVNASYNVTIELTASDLSYDNKNTGLDCIDAQCALDAIKKMIE